MSLGDDLARAPKLQRNGIRALEEESRGNARKAFDLAQKGMGTAKIAEVFHVTRRTVNGWLRRAKA